MASLCVGTTRKDKRSQSWVFFSMTQPTQNLYVIGICSKRWFRAMRLYVMPLQIGNAATFFAFSTFTNNLRNNFSNTVRTFAYSTSPLWVVFFSHFSTASFCHARNRTVFASSSPTLANLKKCVALFTHTRYKRFFFTGFYFLRTLFRAGICRTSYVCKRSSKLNSASSANKLNRPSTLNCSLEFSHG